MKKSLLCLLFFLGPLSAATAMSDSDDSDDWHSELFHPRAPDEPWEDIHPLEGRQATLSVFFDKDDNRKAWRLDYPHNLYVVMSDLEEREFSLRVEALKKHKTILFAESENVLIVKTALQCTTDQIERGAAIINAWSDWLLSCETGDYERSLIVSTVLGLTRDQIEERLKTIEQYRPVPWMHDQEERDIKGRGWIKVIATALSLTPSQIRAGIKAINTHTHKLFPRDITPTARLLTITGALPHTEAEIQRYFGHRESAKETFIEAGLSPADSLELASIVWRIKLKELPDRLKLFHLCATKLFTTDMNIFQYQPILENLLLATPQEMKSRLETLIGRQPTLPLDGLDRCQEIVKTLRQSPEQIEREAQHTSEGPPCVVQ
jgi:hypothetical protein